MEEDGHDDSELFSNGGRASGQIEDKALTTLSADGSGEHRSGRVGQTCRADGFRQAGHDTIDDGQGRLGGDVTRRKARAARRDNDVADLVIAEATELVAYRLLLIAKDRARLRLVSEKTMEKLADDFAGGVLLDSSHAAIGQGAHRPADAIELTVGYQGVARVDYAATPDTSEEPVARHDALAQSFGDPATRMALFAVLGDLEDRLWSDSQSSSDRQRIERDPARQNVLTEDTRRKLDPASTHRVDSLDLDQADLTVPGAGVRITFEAVPAQ